MPGGCARFGPVNWTGEARSLKTGSVSTLRPPACTSTDACPIHVAEGRPGAVFARSAASSGATTGVCRLLWRLRDALAPRLPVPAQQLRQRLRGGAAVGVAEAVFVVVGLRSSRRSLRVRRTTSER